MSENSKSTRHPGVGGEEPVTRSPRLARATICALSCLLVSASPGWANPELEEGPAEAADLEIALPKEESVDDAATADDDATALSASQEEETAPAAIDEEALDDPTEIENETEKEEIAEAHEAEGEAPEAEEDFELDLGEEEDLELSMGSDESILFQEIPSVYGVSKFEQKITEAPSYVTLITSDEIQKYGYRTLAEALQSVTGFFVTYDRNYQRLGVRGFNSPGDFNSRVLVLVDGHRLNDNLYDQGGIGTEAVVDMDLVDRIEVIRGPSSSLYGTNAFFGVINVITKRGRDIRGGELSTEIGSFDTYRGRGTYGDRFSNGIEVLFSGSYYDSAGQDTLFYPEYDNPAQNNGIVNGADDDSFPSFFGKASFRDFTLQGGFVSREKGIPTGAYGTDFPTDRTRSLDEHAYVFLKYEHQFDSSLNVSSRLYYDRFYYQGDYLYSGVLNRDRSTGEWWGIETKVDQRFFNSHNVTAGVEFRHDFRQDLWNGDVNPAFVTLDDKRESWNVAAFLQDEFTILDNLILNAGVRFDYFDSFGHTVNPRVALIYNLENTTFKALYGTAFRGPNPYERFYEGTGFQANPDLDPEEIATYELVVQHSLTPWLRATVAGYLCQIDDLVSQQDTGGALQFQNGGEIEAKGLEFELELDDSGPFGIAGRFGYALQTAEDENDDRLTNSPTHLVNLNMVAPIFQDKLFGGYELQYASDRNTLAGNTSDGYVVSNATVTLKNLFRGNESRTPFFRDLEFSASVRNLFNEKYSDPGSGENLQDEISQDGRAFWFKVKYGF